MVACDANLRTGAWADEFHGIAHKIFDGQYQILLVCGHCTVQNKPAAAVSLPVEGARPFVMQFASYIPVMNGEGLRRLC